MTPDSDDWEYLLEISWRYEHLVLNCLWKMLF